MGRKDMEGRNVEIFQNKFEVLILIFNSRIRIRDAIKSKIVAEFTEG